MGGFIALAVAQQAGGCQVAKEGIHALEPGLDDFGRMRFAEQAGDLVSITEPFDDGLRGRPFPG